MPDYRRDRVPGATYFFTINLLDRDCSLLVEHMHALWTLPELRRRFLAAMAGYQDGVLEEHSGG